MKKLITSLVAVVGLASHLYAQNGTSTLNLQVSTDGTTWSNAAELNPNLGQPRVLIRAQISWNAGSGTQTPIGFASLTWQPVISGVRGGGAIAAFASQGNNNSGGGIDLDASPMNGPFGRTRPFAATGPSGLQSYMAHSHSAGSGGAPAGSYFRISRNDVSRWMGAGPTTGSEAVNNFNGAGGIASVQKASGLVTPNVDPPFQVGTMNITLFQFALDVDTLAPGEMRSLRVMAPIDGMTRNAVTGARQTSWFRDGTDNFGELKADIFVNDAVINLVPSPAAISLLVAAGLIVRPRNRR